MADTQRLRPSLLFGGGDTGIPHLRLWAIALLVFAAGLRLLFLVGPWSGLPADFHSHFGAWAVGEPAERFATEGFGSTGLMPVNWSVELADGTVVRDVYAHHPALFTILVGLSLKLFGLFEWAVRLVPFLFSMLAVWAGWHFTARWFGQRAALFMAAFLGTVPYLAWYGMLAWTEGALVWIGLAQLGSYARWLERPRIRFILEAAAWQFLAGLFDWSGAFLMLGIALHALVFRLRQMGLKACLPLLSMPFAFLLAIGVHAGHMWLVMPAAERSADTSATLAAVTKLTTSVSFWLDLQVRFAWRFLGAPAFLLACLGFLRTCGLAAKGKLGERDALVLVALLPGFLYVWLFPQRSINHDFFLMLSLPGLGLLGAAGLEPVLALVAPKRKLAGFYLAVLGLVLAGTQRTMEIASERQSDQMPRIAAALASMIDNPNAVVLTHIGRGMALPFYSRAEIIHGVNDVGTLNARLDKIVNKLQPGRPAFFLFDTVNQAALASPRASQLMGHPRPDQVAQRSKALIESMAPEEVATLLDSLQVGSLVDLHPSLTLRFPAHLVMVDELGIFEIFDLNGQASPK